jgi:hypothetical protein
MLLVAGDSLMSIETNNNEDLKEKMIVMLKDLEEHIDGIDAFYTEITSQKRDKYQNMLDNNEDLKKELIRISKKFDELYE